MLATAGEPQKNLPAGNAANIQKRVRWHNSFETPRLRGLRGIGAFGLLSLLTSAFAATPSYKLGDIAKEDVVTPVPLMIVNRAETEALQEKVARQIPLILRQNLESASQAEAELRRTVAAAKSFFISAVQHGLQGRSFGEATVDSPVFHTAVAVTAARSLVELPVDQLARLWIRGASEEALVESLVQPVRTAMALVIVSTNAETVFPGDQILRILPVKTLEGTPSAEELEGAEQLIGSEKVMSLPRVRLLLEASFPAGQGQMGRFAASFLRANAIPDRRLTEVLRAKKKEGITVNDTFEAAEVVVRKGQIVDRRALSALTAMREKSLIGTLQSKLDREQTLAGQIGRQGTWMLLGLGAVGVGIVFLVWRSRSGSSGAWVLVDGRDAPLALDSGDPWRQRAIEAEFKAQRAQEAVRAGVMGWMRDKVFRTMAHQRADLLAVQQKAELEMRDLERRLEQLHLPLQERVSAYEKRIEELEQELAAKGEQNRELIGLRINIARQQLLVERERGRFGNN